MSETPLEALHSMISSWIEDPNKRKIALATLEEIESAVEAALDESLFDNDDIGHQAWKRFQDAFSPYREPEA